MNRFAIAQPRSFTEAASLLSGGRFQLPVLKAGGMDIVDHLKEGLIEPDALINIRRVRREGRGRVGGTSPVSLVDGADIDPVIEIEATATMTEISESNLVRTKAPVIAQALERAATPQVRNVGTAAGNLLQRPRCWYYRNDQFDCLKKGGSTCFAAEGENRYHAVFGGGPCHIVHPSNLAPALMVCGGTVHLTGGDRDSLSIEELYHMPDKGILSEHNLLPTEVITHITATPCPASGFYAVKEKQSFDWPLVMCAVSLELDESVIRAATVCAGAVAPIPWMLPRVAAALAGVGVDDEQALDRACKLATDGARPMTDNAYKLKLLPVAVKRAVLRAANRWNDDMNPGAEA